MHLGLHKVQHRESLEKDKGHDFYNLGNGVIFRNESQWLLQ